MEKKHTIQRLTCEQIKHLLDAVQEQSLKTVLTVAITTGLRRGELLGLRWQDIDVENEILHVRRIVGVRGEREATETARTIALPAIVLQALKEHQQNQEKAQMEQGELWQDRGLVFPDENGQYYQPYKLRPLYHAVFVAIGLPDLQFHDLRHSTVTFFIERGVNVVVIQKMLGFRYRSSTLKILTPVSLSMQKDAVKLWDALLTK